jgi:hypothetical protein
MPERAVRRPTKKIVVDPGYAVDPVRRIQLVVATVS